MVQQDVLRAYHIENLGGVAQGGGVDRRERGKFEIGPVDVGEGRTRFLVALAAMSSLLFLISIAFTSLAFMLVPPCDSWF